MMKRLLLVFTFVMMVFPGVWGDVNLQIEGVTINKGKTHELSNDTNYFGAFGQNGTIKVDLYNNAGTVDINATVGAWLINGTGSIFNTIFQNKTVFVPRAGKSSTTLTWVVNSSTALPTERYNVTVFARYPKNSTFNKTVSNTSEYFDVVNMLFGTFFMKHGDKDIAPGDYVEFIHPVTNPGTIDVTPADEISFWYDQEPDGDFDYKDYLEKDSTGSGILLSPGRTENRTYIWQPDYDDCEHSNVSRWMVRSLFEYGYSYIGEVPMALNYSYIYNINSEYARVNDNGMFNYELAPGDTAKGLIDFENWGLSNITLHEAKGWMRYKDNGTLIENSVDHYTNWNFPGNSTACPDDIDDIGWGWRFSFDFPDLFLSPLHDYEIVMAFDYGVPRTDYESDPYVGFNKKLSTQFEFVEADLKNIYFLDEVAYYVDPDFKVEVENVGINGIDSSPKVYLEIYNSSLGYAWNQSSNMTLAASSKSNKSFGWEPVPGASGSPLGSYTVEGRYEYGSGGRTTKYSIIKVVSLGVNNVSSPTVAPYESTNISFNIGNQGPTNATVTSITAGIGSPPVISLDSQSNTVLTPYENKSFTFSYYFNPPVGLTNGSYPINANLSYGGTTVFDSRENITLLPVGIKTFTVPSLGVNTSSVPISITLTNIGSSNVSVSLNLTDNGTAVNLTTVTAAGNGDTTVNFNINITQLGTHNITITADYTGLPQQLVRSGNIQILSTAPDLSVGSISPSPSSPITGRNVSITVSVSNGGTENADNVKVEFLLDSVSMANNTIDVANSSSNNTVFYWTAALGTHDITIVVDPDNSIAGETDETNNNATVSITVTAPPQSSGGGGGGGGGGMNYDVPKCVESLGTADISGKDIAELAYKCGHSSSPAKYIISPSYASLAGVFASQDEVALSPGLSEQLFESHPSSRQGRIIKKEPTILGEDIYKVAANYVLETTIRAKKIVIVRGDLEADSITASTFANLIGAKILLVKPDEVPYVTQDVLDKYRPSTVYIIGGEDAVSPEVAKTIGLYTYKLERINGSTRYETSLEVAKRIMEMTDSRVLVVTDGKEPVTYAASLAVKLNAPLIYMDENSPEEVFKFIGENDFKVVAKLYNE